MAGRKHWEEKKLHEGVKEYTLLSWKYFSNFINKEMLDYTTYVYRGHASSDWKLEPTLDRIIKTPTSYRREEHLQKFKYETRGRRGANPAELRHENDWWALGQHHGLATPLLDWTESPFVALFFAANSASQEKSKFITVFALSQASIDEKNTIVENDRNIEKINDRKPTVKIVRPLSDENSRLVSQRGLFTRGPNNMDIEAWTRKIKSEESQKFYQLIKIHIPNKDIESCLRYLNRMNINHSTLFPDLSGASDFCNSHLIIDKY